MEEPGAALADPAAAAPAIPESDKGLVALKVSDTVPEAASSFSPFFSQGQGTRLFSTRVWAYSANSSALGLSQGSLAKQACTVACKPLVYFSGKSGISAPCSCIPPPCPMKGSSPVRSSYKVTPKAQISVACTASAWEENSSGAM